MYVYIVLTQAKSIFDERNWNDSVPDYSLPWNFSGIILECIAVSFSRGSFLGKNTGVDCHFIL